MEQENPQFNVEVQNGVDFFADQVSVSHNPLRFVIDFTRTAPRIDGSATSQPRLVMSHNVVLVDPYLAVEFINVLKDNIAKYEKRYGKINRPASLRKIDEESKRSGKGEQRQEYFG
ncbi:TPA: DUF3467 domain-containing protein [Candidatus Woesearchaeota archaeon]|nr:DUF3467 domain-containing protein [Candidatus Woesearchaeota archaeon]